MHTQLNPVGNMNILSQAEVDQLQQSSTSELYNLYRSCSLAVLNAGSHTDDAEVIYQQHKDFTIEVLRRERGVKIDLKNPPANAFVDGKIIRGIREHLSAVLRDILYIHNPYQNMHCAPDSLTDATFGILRNANTILPETEARLITCWGGHSIKNDEYRYTKSVGYQLGLRDFNICTGCGPGAMKGPMKGATIGHAKQRNKAGRYIGLTEPSIIAAEPPNAIVNELVIMPDIEKRLEAFVRMSHGLIIFPGGAGTAEELLYILGILLNEENKNQILPIILTGPESAREYFKEIDEFIGATLGKKAQNLYQIIIDDAEKVAQVMSIKLKEVLAYRTKTGDAFHFNWSLVIEHDFQQPFEANHKNMSELNISHDLPTAELAANLRRVFSGIVAGNVKSDGIKAIREHGPFQISGDKKIMTLMDKLLSSFVDQERMKLPGSKYIPCYKVLEG
ncbi:nucleotide 5'-monophosphate nucleosidase PpnN [Colwellia sp. 4_MG-2023]|jgi:predicted Rossmann-fold nucleotide-binding protein|uniref:nucleotide 5'-monophosphate nucleosidase PpnN n=1 Tax=unclassified Colwellia TaxID=196834 RepID=UPI001C08AC92|nr:MULTISPECIES: nucleotide 5'-monophosphate nucleosidase PpnN [unclassified Colwellia]MBU2924665.1 LOG family protein [Colwellia sp. C2M11]MDO6488645.1 nucleotide 5'-monophosphate nucleosidase PpnN [Colwellia sp. 6_MG-2023]MDO6507816.1 nucleotide 5'-monophosphate nucleosidase PpnN [Colwellia sp. 5_MG-2023]MDO6556481.1 nucleotide 5'-monophosphate nucleosidase PpnN [Colwellia sp. 4_MG-2023]MDO6653921.1 nucleotide 5'-monophosphate nucleosidase PpnN [Colwellia sp. 3_MG-2023]